MLRDSGRNRPEGKILETVGVFEAVKQHGKYETGQVRHTLTHRCARGARLTFKVM